MPYLEILLYYIQELSGTEINLKTSVLEYGRSYHLFFFFFLNQSEPQSRHPGILISTLSLGN